MYCIKPVFNQKRKTASVNNVVLWSEFRNDLSSLCSSTKSFLPKPFIQFLVSNLKYVSIIYYLPVILTQTVSSKHSIELN